MIITSLQNRTHRRSSYHAIKAYKKLIHLRQLNILNLNRYRHCRYINMYDHILISYKQHISALFYLSTHLTFWLRLFLCVKSHFYYVLVLVLLSMCVTSTCKRGKKDTRELLAYSLPFLLISLTPCKKKKSCPSRCQQCFFYSQYFTFFREMLHL